jgi:hypothetical protein
MMFKKYVVVSTAVFLFFSLSQGAFINLFEDNLSASAYESVSGPNTPFTESNNSYIGPVDPFDLSLKSLIVSAGVVSRFDGEYYIAHIGESRPEMEIYVEAIFSYNRTFTVVDGDDALLNVFWDCTRNNSGNSEFSIHLFDITTSQMVVGVGREYNSSMIGGQYGISLIAGHDYSLDAFSKINTAGGTGDPYSFIRLDFANSVFQPASVPETNSILYLALGLFVLAFCYLKKQNLQISK